MKRILLAAAVTAAVACSSEPAAVRTDEPQKSAEPGDTRPSGSADPTTTTEAPTTTVLIESPPPLITSPEPEPVTTTVAYVAPATTVRRATTTTVDPDDMPAPQGRTTRGDVWAALADCESGSQNVDTGNGYSGYLQFADATWRSLGYSGRAVDYSYATQIEAGRALQARSGWGQWPLCARQLGLL